MEVSVSILSEKDNYINAIKKIDKTSAYLQIPYLIWLIFAAYLNFGIVVLN